MASLRFPQITDELLSAYLDQAVTDAERALIENAVATDAEVAWRLESMRQTVQLLRALPAVTLPRSFALPELQIAGVVEPVAAAVNTRPATGPARTTQPGFDLSWWWESWRSFWQIGSPLLRNAAAASFALFLVFFVGNAALQTPTRTASKEAVPVAQSAKVESQAEMAAPIATSAKGQAPSSEQSAAPAVAAANPANAVPVADADTQRAALPAAPAAAAMPSNQQAMPADDGASQRQPGPDNSVELAPSAHGGGAVAGNEAGGDLNLAVLGSAESVESASVAQAIGAANAPSASTVMSFTFEEDQTALSQETIALTVALPIANALANTGTITVTSATVFTTEQVASVVTTTTATVGVSVTTDQSSEAAEPARAAESVSSSPSPASLPFWALQWVTALFTLVFGFFWWRSRERSTQAK